MKKLPARLALVTALLGCSPDPIAPRDASSTDASAFADAPPLPSDVAADASLPPSDVAADAPVPSPDIPADAPPLPSDIATDVPSIMDAPRPPSDIASDASPPPSDIPADAPVPSPDIPVDAPRPPSDVPVDAPSVSADVPADVPAPSCGLCATRAEPETSGFISDEDIVEISGLVESRSQPGLYFVHNDSGDSARFFAVDGTGALRGTFVLRGATAVDWEDVAIGPCPAGNCLYFGDMGDNDLVRSNYALYRVPEPTVAPGAAATRDVTWERFPFAYPDGRHNVEALAVRPDTGAVYVFTKVTTLPSVVYRFPSPLRAGATNTLTRVGELALPTDGSPLVTAADIHPCAPRLLVRTYTRLWEFTGPGGSSWEDIFRATPQRVLVQTETQGEAVGWHSNGRGYVTVGEGRGQGLHDARCPR